MPVLGKLNRALFASKLGFVVVLTAVMLAGMILLNPYLLGTQAEDNSGQKTYPDGTVIGHTFDYSQLIGQGDSLILYSYRGRNTFDQDLLDWELYSKPVANRNASNCTEHALKTNNSDRYNPNFYRPIESLPLVLKSGSLIAGSSEKYVCYLILIKPRDSSQVDKYYYLTEKAPKIYTKPTFHHDFERTSDGIVSQLTVLSFDGEENELAQQIEIQSLLAIVGYRHDCDASVEDFYLHARRRDISSLPQELPGHRLEPRDTGKYVCYEIRVYPDTTGTTASPLYYYYVSTEPIPNSGIPHASPTLYDIPDKFNLVEARRILRYLLTREGLEVLDQLEKIAVHVDGCPAMPGVGGCYVSWDKAIYINDDYFPGDYSSLPHSDKMDVIEEAVGVLIHEFWHAVDGSKNPDLNNLINGCHDKTEVKIPTPWGFTTRPSGWLSYHEALRKSVRDCMYKDPEWGAILEALEERFLDENTADRREVVSVSAWGVEDFSHGWYTEFHADLPRYNLYFPDALDNHYGLYFKDQKSFVEILRDKTLFFKLYEIEDAD